MGQERNMQVAEMRLPLYMSGVSRKDGITYEYVTESDDVTEILTPRWRKVGISCVAMSLQGPRGYSAMMSWGSRWGRGRPK